MKTLSLLQPFALVVLASAAAAASAHVSLEQAQAEAGKPYRAVLRVSHGCEGSPTRALSVQLPPGFSQAQPLPRPGWTQAIQGSEVRWTAATPAAALPAAQRGEFVLEGLAPTTPGVAWFKVQQDCLAGSLSWVQLPASGASTEGLKTPAVPLQLLSAREFAALAQAPVQVEGAWVRATVPGQQGTGGFMKLKAREATRLVGVSSPVAGVAEVHEMKHEGGVMRMRALDAIELPAGQVVELAPGGLHLMLMDLKQPLARGASVPVTLHLRNAAGVASQLELSLPVRDRAPGASAGDPSPAPAHKH
ncbi:MAG TPA: copper chaperone PCu(A)C [Ramlibacter sp.]|nr:copper chaperone PCu(A)C [Ramlibacter sp.]